MRYSPGGFWAHGDYANGVFVDYSFDTDEEMVTFMEKYKDVKIKDEYAQRLGAEHYQRLLAIEAIV